jgi:hypothetical protein
VTLPKGPEEERALWRLAWGVVSGKELRANVMGSSNVRRNEGLQTKCTARSAVKYVCVCVLSAAFGCARLRAVARGSRCRPRTGGVTNWAS